jgi:hypothetical protein
MLPALIAMPLAACAPSVRAVPPELPALPPDIRICFVDTVPIPDRPLSVAEVEQLWKNDRARSSAMRRCGRRIVAWYDELRDSWR